MAYVDWIKLEHTTPDKEEVLRMAEILSMNPYEVLGRLVKVWIWADQNLKDGHSSVTNLSQICHIAGVTDFGKAMLEAGWLQRVDGRLVFPNFLRHNGKSAKTRADSQKRQRKSRVCHSSVTDLSQEERDEVVTPSTSTSTSTSTLDVVVNEFEYEKPQNYEEVFKNVSDEVKECVLAAASHYCTRRYGGPQWHKPWYKGMLSEMVATFEVHPKPKEALEQFRLACVAKATPETPRDATFKTLALVCGIKKLAPPPWEAAKKQDMSNEEMTAELDRLFAKGGAA